MMMMLYLSLPLFLFERKWEISPPYCVLYNTATAQSDIQGWAVKFAIKVEKT